MPARSRKRLFAPLEEWFFARYRDFSDIQKLALPHTLRGENTLILAPTGSGKTLAAFLSALSQLGERAAAGKLENAVYVIYVSPLRSLSRDIERNLAGPLAALNRSLPAAHQLRMDVRSGDTSESERARMSKAKPHLLLTTPESLTSLVSQVQWREAFRAGVVIVDEIHSFCESKRGSLLALTLERLEARGKWQRIGLSATAAPIEEVQHLLVGRRECAVAATRAEKVHRLEIAPVPFDTYLPAAGFNPYRVAHVTAALVERAECSLVFTQTRSATERMALALKVLLPEMDDQIETHHASLDRDKRLWVEEQLAAGKLKAVVCSSSLEMGVDFQGVDQVLLIGAPRGVSRALQRLGRGGHRLGGIASGALVPLSLPDLLECIAIRAAVKAGRLDWLRVPKAPLDVLAQVLLGMAVEREWSLAEAWELVRRAGPYAELSEKDFHAVLDYLAGGGKVLGGDAEYGKIVLTRDGFRVASRRVARNYYQNIGTISDDYAIRVVTKTQKRLGDVEESFLSSLQAGEAFVIAGQSVVVKRLHGATAVVEAAKGERVQTPRWMGGKMSLSARLAQEELRLRRDLRAAWETGGAEECVRRLMREWGVERENAERAAGYVQRQAQAAPVPVDRPVQLEMVRDGKAQLYIFHSVAGRGVNRSLIWTVSHRLGQEYGSIVGNFDDHAFLFSFAARRAPGLEQIRACFCPDSFREDLEAALQKTELLGSKFRPICETGQLLPRRNSRENPGAKRAATWNGRLLFETFRKYEPEHPLLREAVREILEDELDQESAVAQAKGIFDSDWEIYELPRPSPFAIPLFSAFNREALVKQDADAALEEVVKGLYEQWNPKSN